MTRRRLAALLAAALLTFPTLLRADDWPEWLGPQRDSIWREAGLMDHFPPGGPPVKWRAPLNVGYAGPAVAEGRVYVMDWKRAVDEQGNKIRPTKQGVPGSERVVCFDAASGKQLWEHGYTCPYKVSYPNGPRTTPVVRGGKVYTLGTMGELCCLDAGTGKPAWQKNIATDYKTDSPVWGYAAHLLLDGDLLFCLVGGAGSAAVAFNKDTGKEVWKALTTEEVGYAPPIIVSAAGKRQLIVWHTEAVNGLDPASGQVYWTHKYPADGKVDRPGVTISQPRQVGDMLFVTTVYHGPLMLKLDQDKPGATLVWQHEGTMNKPPEGLSSLMTTPAWVKGYLYGIGMNGELSCTEAATGKELWQTFAPIIDPKDKPPDPKRGIDCGSAFLIELGEGSNRFLIFNDSGDLILADLTPAGYKEVSRARVLEPTHAARGRVVVWSHPACAGKCVFVRNDKEIICVSLAASDAKS